MEAVVEAHWPEAIDPAALADPALVAQIEAAHAALLETLDLSGYLTINHRR
ncbi:hypothetical protein [Clostridium perfringens]